MRNAARTLIGMAAAIFLLSGATSSLAQDANNDPIEPAFDRDCLDENGRDLCDPVIWSGIVGSFQLQSAEEVQAQGWRGVRVFTIDGSARDMPVVTVLHRGRPGFPEDAILDIRGIRPTRSDAFEVMRLSRPAWLGLVFIAHDLQSRVGSSSGRQSTPPPTITPTEQEGVEQIVVCVHAWVTVTESLTDEGVERRVRNACGDDPLYDMSSVLSAQALLGFPHCNHLDPEFYRQASNQLEACLMLGGRDLFSAAMVLSLIEAEGSDGWRGVERYLEENVELVSAIAGTVEGAEAVTSVLRSESRAPGYAAVTRVTGEPARVLVAGEFEQFGRPLRFADFEQTWIKVDGEWRVTRMTVGPFRELKPDDE